VQRQQVRELPTATYTILLLLEKAQNDDVS
jgi:hypothetical protein